jgi:hypothetical protein
MRFDFAGHNLIVPFQCRLSFRRMRFPSARRSFYIREQERHDPNRSIRHWQQLWKPRNRRATSTFILRAELNPDAQRKTYSCSSMRSALR